MPRRQLILPLLFFLLTIFLISKMVSVHAEDSTDESAYPTATAIVDYIETTLPTMTEFAYDQGDPTQTTIPNESMAEATNTVTISSTPAGIVDPTAIIRTPLADKPLASPTAVTLTQSDTPTPVIIPRASTASQEAVRTCAAHTTELFVGTTSPSTMLEARFDKRVVGGGMSEASGHFALPVYVGHEISGRHFITIVKRYSGRQIQQVLCEIP